ncbi:hypothetical protein M8C21_008824, partial [Ambrosia artemisiifolia]
MAMMEIVTEEFKEENYEFWKTCLQSYLVGQGLWDVVIREATPEDKDKSEEWKRKNAQALHAIQLACGSQAYAKFKKNAHVTAKIAWDHLVEMSTIPPQHSGVTHDQQDKLEDKKPPPNQDLYNAIENEICNAFSDTPLSLIAAMTENTELAKAMLEKNHNLVSIKGGKTGQSSLPVIVASMYGRKQMVHYLYSETPEHLLKGQDGVLLLSHLITAEFFDIASNLVPNLGIMVDQHGDYALHKLAHKPSAFASGSKFPFWKKWIYN